MLIISGDQVATLDEIAVNDFYRRALGFLMNFFASDLKGVDQRRIYNFIKHNKAIAEDHGVCSERGLMMWIFLCFATKKKFYLDINVKQLFIDGSKSEDNLLNLFDRLVELQLRQEKKP